MSAPPVAQEQPPVPGQVGSPEHQKEAEIASANTQHLTAPSNQDVSASDTPPQPFVELDDGKNRDQDQDVQRASDKDEGSYYWNASTMAPLNAASAAAIARLRAYKPPPFPLWDRLPLSRRAAVLLLLYADRRGDLRVVITMRAASLRSFSGHAALPGGKADTLQETPYQIARREAWEEIGLPLDDTKLPPPFRIEHLCCLPMNLARTELVVRPCVAFLHTGDTPITKPGPNTSSSSSSATTGAPASPTPTVEESLIPRLDAKEVAAVFSAPLHNFLRATDEVPPSSFSSSSNQLDQKKKLPPGPWYEGSWTTWHDSQWRMHFFYVPVTDQTVVKPRVREGGLAALSEHEAHGCRGENNDNDDHDDKEPSRYKVWGMTARILVDAATVAYGEEPEFEHNTHFGDEALIELLAREGRMGEKKRTGSVLAAEDLKRVREAVGEAEEKRKEKEKKDKGEASKM
ncbi:hypothetical protein C7999DRAFT_28246 [Corynascus novoguineensis]|uniref:Nudix hydrolase domain-containing protein n=1 Tax=Corynascus novoguineensis TaxID=1126955 RepID=A0AAN7D0G9_9PEZI|nr:hypothetical protein C7999DRAFT_28246 [Corynascus novoguineensis]